MPCGRYRSVGQLGLHISVSLPYAPFSTDFISVGGTCVSSVPCGGSCLGSPDLPAMESGLHLGAGC